MLSLVGDIAEGENGEPKLHAHVVLDKRDGLAVGGHLSLTGLLMGFVGWMMARKAVGFGLSVAGMLLSLAALILDCVIAGLGLELIKLHSLQ